MNLCLNYEICKQVKYKILHLYCTDCFIYFNKKIDLVKNEKNNQCPICGSDAIYGVWESSQDQDDYYN